MQYKSVNIIDLFDYIFTQIKDKHFLLKRIKFYSLLRFIVTFTVNAFFPLYFRITQRKKTYCMETCTQTEGRIIVSLTSFPLRIGRVWLVIETILRQTQKPDKLILWLSEDQFSSIQKLPKNLLRLQKRGLEIRLCKDDLRSHKKYFYAMREFPNDIIITIDDDVLYNTHLLFYLIDLNQKFPLSICCTYASNITLNENKITSYKNWQCVENEKHSSYNLLPIGMGGILYPPHSLHPDVFNVDVFKKYCFLADDIWLNIMARLQGTVVSKTNYTSNYLSVFFRKNQTLASKNQTEGLNDVQLNSMREYCMTKYNIDPYKFS